MFVHQVLNSITLYLAPWWCFIIHKFFPVVSHSFCFTCALPAPSNVVLSRVMLKQYLMNIKLLCFQPQRSKATRGQLVLIILKSVFKSAIWSYFLCFLVLLQAYKLFHNAAGFSLVDFSWVSVKAK